jgi:HK97 family phage portal protein
MGIFDKFRKPVEQKSVSLPEVLFTFNRGFPQWQNWDAETAVEEGLKASSIFYACCRLRADAVAQVPWVVKRKVGNEMEQVDDSPLHRILERPNDSFSWAEMMEHLVYHLDLAGNSYWSILRAGNEGLPREVWSLLPQAIKIIPGRESLIEQYRYDYRGTIKDIDAADMCHVKTVNPNDYLFGLPTIQAAGKAVDIDREAGQWQYSSLHNRGVSDYAIIIDPSTTPEQVERLKQLHKERNAGADNARSPMLSTRDIKTMNQTAVEMDFVASRTKVWSEIASAMGVPLPMIGVLEDATLANIETSRKIFWMDTIVPLLRKIRSQVNAQLASEFGLYLDYDLSAVEAMREDYGQKLEAAERLFRLGVPFNRINEVLELEIGEIEGGDTGYLPAGLIPSDLEPIELADADPETLKNLAYGSKS